GRARVEARFTWDAVVAAHLGLWERLAAVPVPDAAGLRALAHPGALAYGDVFAGYPVEALSDAVRLTWSRAGRAVYHNRDYPIVYAGLGEEISLAAVRTLLFLARGGCPGLTLAARLAAAEPSLDLWAARFHVVWALKQDLLEKEAS
ncbi:MAG TPA: glycosyl transferase, partial [Solidesulfovibrio sp.]|nr:glycosyl transferase [Desulfovibrio sp.]HML61888.1 glycosyl transferase [Solidesulfovibrio sp.]